MNLSWIDLADGRFTFSVSFPVGGVSRGKFVILLLYVIKEVSEVEDVPVFLKRHLTNARRALVLSNT